jgi:AraC-like DNA-binding protein
MVRLVLAKPLIEDLQGLGINIQPVISKFSITREDFLDQNLWIPAKKMYALVERLAEASGDPYFGVHSSEKLDPCSWPPTSEAMQRSSTLSEFFLRFIEDTQADTNSCFFILKTIGDRSTFRECRVTDAGGIPRHNDGYTVTYLLSILRGAVGPQWDGGEVLARVCDPTVIPPGYLGIRTAIADTLGASISFPTRWLLLPIGSSLQKKTSSIDPNRSTPAGDIISAFRYSVAPHISELGLNIQRVSELCGLNKRTLARKLKLQGTTAGTEIGKLRQARAEQQLLETDLAITRIAVNVGYSDPVVFSRAFKRWSGLSPRQYRVDNRRYPE